MGYIHYGNMTIEIVTKPLDIDTTKTQYYLSNMDQGGIGIRKNIEGYNRGLYYIGSSYSDLAPEEPAKIGQIYSLSTGYDGSNIYFRENDNLTTSANIGTAKKPNESTVFAIGTNPKGTGQNLSSSEARSNIEVFSVRIYNRCLTQEEIEHNYKIDKERFNI